MAVLHSALAAYGVFDQVAVQTEDPEILALIEKLVPGTTGKDPRTGKDQRGWYAELQAFVHKTAKEQAAQRGESEADAETKATFPSFEGAVSEIMSAGGDASPQVDHRVKQRLLYTAAGLGALQKLTAERGINIPTLTEITDSTFARIFAFSGGPAVMAENETADSSSASTPAVTMANMSDVLKAEGLKGWNKLMAEVTKTEVSAPAVPRDVAATPAVSALGESEGPLIKENKKDANGKDYTEETQGKVSSEVIVFDDIVCSLLTTDFYRTPYDINEVKNNIQPLNWDNANKFFADMNPSGRSRDGRAYQVLEEVSTDPEVYRIKTNLKYIKETRAGDNYVINYDFADDRGPNDSDQVLVDSGYIVARPTEDGNGVRVITSKMVAIEGLSPTAVAVFAHAMGWLSIGEMMIFGKPVNQPGDPVVNWDYEPPEPNPTQTSMATPAEDGPKRPQPVSRILVKETTNALVDYVETASKETLVVADKWFQGKLTVQDMLNHTQKLGGLVFSQPFRVLDKMMKEIAGPPGGQKDGAQQQGGGSA